MEENQSISSSRFSFISDKFSNLNKKTVISLGVLALLLVGIPIGVYLVQQTQIFKPKASELKLVSGPETSFSLSASSSTVAPGQQVRVLLYARSDVDAANLFTAKLKFPANLLKVTSINTVSTSSAGPAVKGVSKALALSSDGSYCAQVITRACSPDAVPVCKEFGSPCEVPVGWRIDNSNTGGYCAQVITRACDIKSTECKDFPTPCDVPVGWRIDNSTIPQPIPTDTIPPTPLTKPPTATPTVIAAPMPVNKDYFISNWMEKVPDNTAGTISLSGGVPNPGFKSILGQDSRIMAEIVFTALANGDANITFEPDSAIYRNSDNTNILGVKRDATIKISATPTPTSIPGISCDINGDGLSNVADGALITACWNKPATGTCLKFDIDKDGTITTTDIQKFSYNCPQIFATPTPTGTTGIKGDVNGDGKIGLVDMSALLSKWAKTGTEAGKADINIDGVVNTFDYSLLLQILIQNGVIKESADLPASLQR